MFREDIHVCQFAHEPAGLLKRCSRGALHYTGRVHRIVEKRIFAKHPRMQDESNFEILDRIYEQVIKDAEEKMSFLLIMDDAAASLKNLEIQMLLKKIIHNRRYYHVLIICLVQSYIAMPLAIRKMTSHLACYKPRKKKSARWEEHVFLDKEMGEAL
jgi:hypothetical protein